MISFYFAFVGGLISFLSPCVLPIIPGFLAYLAGSSLQNYAENRKAIFLNSAFFVLGFSVVFALLGVLLNTVLIAAAYSVQLWLSRIGGAIIIFFGLFLMGLIKPQFLQQEHAFRVTHTFHSKYLTSFAFGAAFAAGWTPCVGAVLGGILGLAAAHPGSAFALLFAYSVGLGVPFLVVGAFAAPAAALLNRIAAYVVYLDILFGIFLVILGILAFTQNLSLIANFQVLNSFFLR
ncbi:MAG: cytochrome C biogenesis protein [Patescibacteria group bacterium]|nr:cytochrome C biogenesis protein [Patescibacteria group bacterium]